VRGAVGVKLVMDSDTYWVPSLHLKAACKDDRIEPDTEDDCITQRKQFDILSRWVKSKPVNDKLILAGDFNRKLFNKTDSIRTDIIDKLGSNVSIVPEKQYRGCWQGHRFDFKKLKEDALANNPEFEKNGITPRIYLPSSNREIDFFIIVESETPKKIASDQIEMGGSYRFVEPGSTINSCDGSMKVTNPAKKETLTFAKSYPSDHCPIALTIPTTE
jgi:hypothetical protein